MALEECLFAGWPHPSMVRISRKRQEGVEWLASWGDWTEDQRMLVKRSMRLSIEAELLWRIGVEEKDFCSYLLFPEGMPMNNISLRARARAMRLDVDGLHSRGNDFTVGEVC